MSQWVDIYYDLPADNFHHSKKNLKNKLPKCDFGGKHDDFYMVLPLQYPYKVPLPLGTSHLQLLLVSFSCATSVQSESVSNYKLKITLKKCERVSISYECKLKYYTK